MFAVSTKEQTATIATTSQNKSAVCLADASVTDVANVISKGITANGVLPSGVDGDTLANVAAGVHLRYGRLTLSELYAAFICNVRSAAPFRYYSLPTFVNNIIAVYVRQKMEAAHVVYKEQEKEKHRAQMVAYADEERYTLYTWWLHCRHGRPVPTSFAAVLYVELRIWRLTGTRLPFSDLYAKNRAEALRLSCEAVRALISEGMTLGEWLAITPLAKTY